jgi:hypothetical protein
MTCGSGPRRLAELSSSTATYFSALDLTSLPRWAPVLPCVPWHRDLPPREESSGTATCYSTLDLASLSRWASALPRGPGLASMRGELRYCDVSHGPQRLWTIGTKKGLAAPGTSLGSHVSKAQSRVTEAPTRCADMPLQFSSTVQHDPTDHSWT